MRIIKTAVIGVGYLGKFHAQKFATLPNSQLIGVCDSHQTQCEQIATQCKTQAFFDYKDLIGHVDAVSIATPTPSHYQIAHFFLEHGVHVLIEKPITTTLHEANALINLAKEKNVVLQVGHLERFNNVIIKAAPRITRPLFIESSRLAPFQLRGTDVNVVLDLMIHDLDIVQYLVKSEIRQIAANGASILTPFMDIANARVEFDNGCVANMTASRVSVTRERKLRIFQSDSYVSLDLDNKIISAHYKGEKEMFPGIPEIVREESLCDQGDPLLEQAKAFLRSISTGTPAVVSGEDGKHALKTAIEITQILHQNKARYEKDFVDCR